MADRSEATIRSARRGHVYVVTLARPAKRNALDSAMIAGLADSLDEAAGDPEVRAVVLTAEGPAFCAGMDLAEFNGGDGLPAGGSPDGSPPDPDTTSDRDGILMRLMRSEYPKPVVAGVNGAAVGGGFELVLGCDLVVAADRAVFGLPEVTRGLFAGGNGTLLPARVPRAVALELGLTGDPMPAARALEVGLVNRVVPADDVWATALGLAERIAADAPLAVCTTRRLMLGASGAGTEQAWDAIAAAWGVVTASEDAREGARAYVEKRSPSWTGR